MALVALKTPTLFYPIGPGISVGTSTYALTAANHSAANVVQCLKDGTIDRIGFYVAGHTTGATLNCTFQGVNSSGHPDGTNLGSSGTGTATTTGANTWYEATISSPPTVTRGQVIAIRVSQPGTSAGNCTLASQDMWGQSAFPYGALNTGSWAKLYYPPLIYARYSDGTYMWVPRNLSAHTLATSSFASNTSGSNERGNKITMKGKARIIGAELLLNSAAAFDLRFYDGTTQQLSKPWTAGHTAAAGYVMATILFDGTYTMVDGGTYRLTVKPTTTTSLILIEWTSKDASPDMRGAMFGGGDMVQTVRLDAGGWTDVADKVMQITPLIDQIEDGAGGGGGLAALPIGGYVR